MNLPVRLSQRMNLGVLKLKKESPHIFFALGVVGTVASTVLACRATLRLEKTLDTIKGELNQVEAAKGKLERLELDYSETEHRKELVYVYVRGGTSIAKLYGPSVILGVTSIGLLTGSHVQLSRRNASIMAAYAALQKAYDEYRERVREELGDDRERELFHAGAVELEDGKIVKTDPSKLSVYSVIFDEYNPNWEKDPELNRLFISCQQTFANQRLRAKGHVFLNEIYDWLGMERTKAGAVVGWVISKDGPNFIDFGIYDSTRFVNNMERSIILDFNVEGVIYDKI